MNNRYEGGDLLVESLQALGVGQVFSVSGGPLNSLYHAAASHGLPIVHTRHEAAAGFMADAVSRITGTPGVVAVTLGPGVTNTITPALVAEMAGTPLLIIGAQANTRAFERGAGMSADHVPIMAPVTKWSARVLHTDRIPEYVEAAWRKMWAGRPGPVFLEIPVDVLSAPTERADPATYAPHRAGLGDTDRASLLEYLADAKRPIMILGDEIRWERPQNLDAVIDNLQIPFVTLRLARGAVTEKHQKWAGPGYVPCNDSLAGTLEEADLVLIMGHHFEFDLGFGDIVPKGTRIVQTASDPALLGRNRRATLEIMAGPEAVFGALGDAQVPALDKTWVQARIDAWRKERAEQGTADSGTPLHPITAIDAVVSGAPPDTVYVTSHGNIDFWADARLQVVSPDLYLRAGQAGALGAEIPFGVGARFANPDRPVIVFVGDGGVGYHLTELDTAARYDRPIIIAVLDDQKWSAIALPQKSDYGGEYEMDLPRRDWAKVAEGLGGNGYKAETVDEIQNTIRLAIESGKPSIVQIPVKSVLSPYMAAITK